MPCSFGSATVALRTCRVRPSRCRKLAVTHYGTLKKAAVRLAVNRTAYPSRKGELMAEQEIYWKAENQEERLAELTGAVEASRDLPLRRDVRSLGYLLGQVIIEQAGRQVYRRGGGVAPPGDPPPAVERPPGRGEPRLPRREGAPGAGGQHCPGDDGGGGLPDRQGLCHLFRADQPGRNQPPPPPAAGHPAEPEYSRQARHVPRDAPEDARRGDQRRRRRWPSWHGSRPVRSSRPTPRR